MNVRDLEISRISATGIQQRGVYAVFSIGNITKRTGVDENRTDSNASWNSGFQFVVNERRLQQDRINLTIRLCCHQTNNSLGKVSIRLKSLFTNGENSAQISYSELSNSAGVVHFTITFGAMRRVNRSGWWVFLRVTLLTFRVVNFFSNTIDIPFDMLLDFLDLDAVEIPTGFEGRYQNEDA